MEQGRAEAEVTERVRHEAHDYVEQEAARLEVRLGETVEAVEQRAAAEMGAERRVSLHVGVLLNAGSIPLTSDGTCQAAMGMPCGAWRSAGGASGMSVYAGNRSKNSFGVCQGTCGCRQQWASRLETLTEAEQAREAHLMKATCTRVMQATALSEERRIARNLQPTKKGLPK